MKFSIKNVFTGITLAQYESLFFDKTFNEAMMPVAGLKRREELEAREEKGIIHRRLHVVPERDFPPPLNKFIKGELSYIEIGAFDPAAHHQKWTSEISVLPDKVKLGGDVTFKAVPAGVERVVSGTCTVSIFGLGGVIEKIIVDNLEETYAKVSKFTQQYIDAGKASQV